MPLKAQQYEEAFNELYAKYKSRVQVSFDPWVLNRERKYVDLVSFNACASADDDELYFQIKTSFMEVECKIKIKELKCFECDNRDGMKIVGISTEEASIYLRASRREDAFDKTIK